MFGSILWTTPGIYSSLGEAGGPDGAEHLQAQTRCVLDYHDWVYEHQAEINADNFENKAFEFARSKGIDVLQLKSMLGSKAMEQEVERTLAMGRDLNVQSTPTLFVNGRKIGGAVDWRELKRIIDYEIEYQKQPRTPVKIAAAKSNFPYPE